MPADIDNRTLTRRLVAAAGLTLVALLAGANARQWDPEALAPGTPLMQSFGIVGAICLLGAASGALSKRFGACARRGFQRHLWLSMLGTVLVAFHSTGALEFPALMLLLIVALGGAGWWGRAKAPVSLSRGFGRKPAMFDTSNRRAEVRELIIRKTALLAQLDSNADEALFSLQPRHWLRAPLLSCRFHRAVVAERALLGAHRIYVTTDRLWRLAHQLLAWSLVLGIVVHVVLCVFFAGYVADGRPIYWWHVTAWTF